MSSEGQPRRSRRRHRPTISYNSRNAAGPLTAAAAVAVDPRLPREAAEVVGEAEVVLPRDLAQVAVAGAILPPDHVQVAEAGRASGRAGVDRVMAARLFASRVVPEWDRRRCAARARTSAAPTGAISVAMVAAMCGDREFRSGSLTATTMVIASG